MQESYSICARLEKHADFLSPIVTMDETWMHFYDPETKQELKEWRLSSSPKPVSACIQKSAKKVIASIFWGCHEVIMFDCLDRGRTVTANYYCILLTTLQQEVKNRKTEENYPKMFCFCSCTQIRPFLT